MSTKAPFRMLLLASLAGAMISLTGCLEDKTADGTNQNTLTTSVMEMARDMAPENGTRLADDFAMLSNHYDSMNASERERESEPSQSHTTSPAR